jgi:ubiquinone/menaquinone biosynthesis C-methylase UbiE
MNDQEIKDAVRKVWDLSSTTYDNIPGHRIGTSEENTAWIQELGRDLPSAALEVLDVGCGTCAMGLLFAEMGHQVTGVDLSEDMIARARRKAEESRLVIDLRTCDAEHLPFEDGSFDVIVTRHLLWTLPNPEIALKEWFRVLTPGGMLLVIDGVWNDNRPGTQVRMRISSGMTRIFEPQNTHPASYSKGVRTRLPLGGGVPEETMRAYLGQAGFLTIQFRDLMYITELQKSQLPWYRKLAQGKSYYIVAAKKPEGCIL